MAVLKVFFSDRKKKKKKKNKKKSLNALLFILLQKTVDLYMRSYYNYIEDRGRY